jgi:hypothetical protein
MGSLRRLNHQVWRDAAGALVVAAALALLAVLLFH